MVTINKKAIMIKRALIIRKMRIAALKKAALKKKKRIRQALERFHVIATNLNNATRDTTGWTAVLTRGTTTITADFDDFGVARFATINTLTTVSYVLRIRNADNDLLTTKNVPADIEVFVARF